MDFNGAEAIQPASATLTVAGADAGQLLSLEASFATEGGGVVLFTSTLSASSSIPFMGVSSANSNAGDLHALSLAAQDDLGNGRAVESYFRTAGNRGMTLGPALSPVTVTPIAGTPNIRLRMDIPSLPAYNTSAVAEISAGGVGPLARNFEIAVTAGYLGAVPSTWSVTMPDLTGASGFDPNFAMQTTIGIYYDAVLTGGNRLFFAPPADGQLLSYALRQGESISTTRSVAAGASVPRANAFRRPWRSSLP